MKNTIYHNPRCSKSRISLGILNDKDIEIDVVEYLKNPPSVKTLKWLCVQLNVSPIGIIRTQEELFKELGLSASDEREDEAWLKIIHEHPKLLERPIVIIDDKVVIGRPPENVLTLLS